jgi:UDP:flavonoid glycosyltransferase YjiC (YdhE family)
MRVLFTGIPVYGHLLPMLPLAVAARAAGDEVAVTTAEPKIAHPDSQAR